MSVKLKVLLGNPVLLRVHRFVLGLGLGDMVAPVGIVRKSMLWMLVVSLLMNSIVVPGATVTLAGLKFRAVFAPIPAGK